MNTIISLPLFFIAVIVHEYAHGWTAYKLGDPTAKYAGRLTFNPLAHIDPMGTIFLPLLLTVMRSPVVFGWAKPVPINFALLRRPKRDMLLVSMAGIAANLLMAVFFSILLKTGLFLTSTYGWLALNYGILVNLVLAVFNAVPVPPLDGSKILLGVLPRELAFSYMQLERYGMLVLIILLWSGLFDLLIWPVIIWLARILGVAL